MPNVPKQSGGEPAALDTFTKALLRSSLISAGQLQTLLEAAPPEVRDDAKALAAYLVKAGKLTRFQAGKLLKGVSLGLVFGPYHILAPIGKGGMASVFLARDRRNQMLVAVKVLPPKRAKAQERLVHRFRREMEICKRVDHPYLTRTIEAGEQLGVNYIAMEYIPGRNMYRLVHDKGPITVERAAKFFVQVSAGLEHAHSLGLIHRDLKPSNIMVMPNDNIKVLDLGLALMEGEADGEPRVTKMTGGYIVGTPDYMPPEQAADPLKVDIRSDIYALGCTMYFVLTGQTPFSGGNMLQKLLRHRCDPPPAATNLNPQVPVKFAALLTQMMAKSPEQRFQSAADVRKALLPWCAETAEGQAVSTPVQPDLIEPGPAAEPGLPAQSEQATPPVARIPEPSGGPKLATSLLPEAVPFTGKTEEPAPSAGPAASEASPGGGVASPAAYASAPAKPATPSKPMPVQKESAKVAPQEAPAAKRPLERPTEKLARVAAATGSTPAPTPTDLPVVPSESPAKAGAVAPPRGAADTQPVRPISDRPSNKIPTVPAEESTEPAPKTDLPFFLDFTLPVVGSVLFLLTTWVVVLLILLNR